MRSARLLAGLCAALVVAAALLWAGSARFAPGLSGVALLGLAGVAAVVATGGVLRRVVGVLLTAAGAAAGVVAVLALAHESPTGPLLVLAGGLLLLAAGIAVVLAEPRLGRLGARYAAPGVDRREVDPDRAAWQDLDAGRDPTATPSVDRGDDPGAGSRPV